jgi:hypothetical protein
MKEIQMNIEKIRTWESHNLTTILFVQMYKNIYSIYLWFKNLLQNDLWLELLEFAFLRLFCLLNWMVCIVVTCLCLNLLVSYLWKLWKIMSNLKWYSNLCEMMFSCVVIETRVVGQYYANENSICEYIVDYVHVVLLLFHWGKIISPFLSC